FGSALIEYAVEIVESGNVVSAGQPSTQSVASSRREPKQMMRRDFGAPTIRFHGPGVAVHDIVVDAILEVVARCIDPAQPPYVRVIFTKQEFRPVVKEEPQRREPRAIDRDRIILACNEL